MVKLLHDAMDGYDFVLIDTPPTSVVADALHLFPHVDGVLVVTRLGSTPRDRARQLAAQLQRLAAPVLGIVVNGTPSSKRYGHYGDYGYEYHPSVARVSANGSETSVKAPSNLDDPVGSTIPTEGS